MCCGEMDRPNGEWSNIHRDHCAQCKDIPYVVPFLFNNAEITVATSNGKFERLKISYTTLRSPRFLSSFFQLLTCSLLFFVCLCDHCFGTPYDYLLKNAHIYFWWMWTIFRKGEWGLVVCGGGGESRWIRILNDDKQKNRTWKSKDYHHFFLTLISYFNFFTFLFGICIIVRENGAYHNCAIGAFKPASSPAGLTHFPSRTVSLRRLWKLDVSKDELTLNEEKSQLCFHSRWCTHCCMLRSHYKKQFCSFPISLDSSIWHCHHIWYSTNVRRIRGKPTVNLLRLDLPDPVRYLGLEKFPSTYLVLTHSPGLAMLWRY